MIDISKKIGISVLAFLVFSFPILNCCLLEFVFADTAVEYSHHKDLAQTQQEDRHPHGSDSADTSSNEDCDWEGLAVALPNQTFIYFNSFAAKVFSFHSGLAAFNKAYDFSLGANSFYYLRSPPQNYRTSVPIYLQFSTLRI